MRTTLEYLQAAASTGRVNAPSLSALGKALIERDEIDAAIPCLRKAVELEPGGMRSAVECGDALAASGNRAEAERMYLRAYAGQPGAASVCERLGRLHASDAAGVEMAAEWFVRAIDLDPDSFVPYLGLCRLSTNETSDCDLVLHRMAARIGRSARPVPMHRAMATALEGVGRYLDARRWWLAASQELPGLLGLTNNYLATRNIEEADRCSLEALRIAPSSRKAHADRARFFRMAGRIEEARAMFRRAFVMGERERPKAEGAPTWDGSPPSGKMILLKFGTEAGYGDLIQHLATAQMLASEDAIVVIECPQRRLHPLLRTARGVSAVIAPYDAWAPAHYQSDPLHALGLLDWDWNRVRSCVPYFDLPAHDPWFLPGAIPKLRIGLHWAGRNLYPRDPYRYRSIRCSELEPLTTSSGIAAYSLQRKDANGRTEMPTGTMDLGESVGEFIGVAHAISEMDLIVAVDSAMAHLAGALGRPSLLMIPYFPAEQWMFAAEKSDRAPSLWYPTVTIFRQARPGAWSDVVARVVNTVAGADGPIQASRQSPCDIPPNATDWPA
jgi:tetratricopeptide (TPR) repeat protein